MTAESQERCGDKSPASTKNASNSLSRKVKVEDDAQRLLPVRYTRRHDKNPHSACLTCARAYTNTFPEDLPPSSPPLSPPPATPPLLMFSLNPSYSSDAQAGLSNSLTPVASDDEEADIDLLRGRRPRDNVTGLLLASQTCPPPASPGSSLDPLMPVSSSNVRWKEDVFNRMGPSAFS